MTQKHTPLPWGLSEPGERIAFALCHISGANHRPVATTVYPLAPPDWYQEDVANARFIVQACNAHEDLLAALKVMVFTRGIWEHLEATDPMALEQARTAIAKAMEG